MPKRKPLRRACARACLCAAALALALACAASFRPRAASSASRRAAAQEGGERVDIRLRSLTTRATGKLTVEASEGGGRARLTALNLPDPQTVAAGATTYVVWAVSDGRRRAPRRPRALIARRRGRRALPFEERGKRLEERGERKGHGRCSRRAA